METVSPPDAGSKRKRTPSESAPPNAPAAKVSKTGNNSLSINYLVRHMQDDLPLLKNDDTLPNTLQLLSAYSNVLDRHESLASNLGATPLGPILIKRFERCFESAPKVVASHHKGSSINPDEGGHSITWLEVIEFARAHPSQFTLSTFSEGKRVCQFYYPQKQLRVQISEEDFLFINSGRCQELIPPLPIWEDEEKEVGTCDVLEAKLKELTNIADMVAARTRQLSHRLKGRRVAILERRAEGGSGTPAKASAQQVITSSSSAGGTFPTLHSSGDGEPSTSSIAAVRAELLRHFESLPQNQAAQARPHSRHHSLATAPAEHQSHDDGAASTTSSLSPVPTNLPNDPLSYYVSDAAPAARPSHAHSSGHHRPSVSVAGHTYNVGPTPSKHNFSRPLPPALESSQPFRPLCQAHMDGLPRGHRVIPPCDRCRRLRMDCVKNLTSCAGCTKKHARCHWRDVSREELGDLDHLIDSNEVNAIAYADEANINAYQNGGGSAYPDDDSSDDDESNPLEDLEALGEKEDQREKELEERAKEDEEGLGHARELARQGREGSIRSIALQENHVAAATAQSASTFASNEAPNDRLQGTVMGELAANRVPDTLAGEPAASRAQNTTVGGLAAKQQDADEARDLAGLDGSHSPAALRNASFPSTAFIPLPAQSSPAGDTPSYSGFHAVNGGAGGGNWRAT